MTLQGHSIRRLCSSCNCSVGTATLSARMRLNTSRACSSVPAPSRLNYSTRHLVTSHNSPLRRQSFSTSPALFIPKPPPSSSSHYNQKRFSSGNNDHLTQHSIIILNIPPGIEPTLIRRQFSQHGKILHFRFLPPILVPYSPAKGQVRKQQFAFAFVAYQNNDSVDRAIWFEDGNTTWADLEEIGIGLKVRRLDDSSERSTEVNRGNIVDLSLPSTAFSSSPSSNVPPGINQTNQPLSTMTSPAIREYDPIEDSVAGLIVGAESRFFNNLIDKLKTGFSVRKKMVHNNQEMNRTGSTSPSAAPIQHQQHQFEPSKTIVISNIHASLSQAVLQNHFATYGQITSFTYTPSSHPTTTSSTTGEEIEVSHATVKISYAEEKEARNASFDVQGWFVEGRRLKVEIMRSEEGGTHERTPEGVMDANKEEKGGKGVQASNPTRGRLVIPPTSSSAAEGREDGDGLRAFGLELELIGQASLERLLDREIQEETDKFRRGS